MKRLQITVDGRAYAVTITTDADGMRTVTVDGHTYRAGPARLAPRSRALQVAIDGTSHAVRRDELERADVDGTTSVFFIDDIQRGGVAGAVGAAGARIHPPMPGKIVALRVDAGEEVVPGQVLFVLEAMKMQNEVTSPAAGTVTAIRRNEGDNVDTKDVVVELGPPEDEAERPTEIAA